MSPRRLPIFLDLSRRRLLIVGGGHAAERKLPALLESGARITLVAPRIRDAVRELMKGHELIERSARCEDVTSAFTLFFPLTDDAQVNQALSAAARAAGVMVAGCSDQRDSDFFMGAVVERGPLRIAISTDGRAPGLARKVAAWLRAQLPSPSPTTHVQGSPRVES